MTSPQDGEKTCRKFPTYESRLAARTRLLELWKYGNYKLKGSHWCQQHNGWHLTKSRKNSGNNYAYRD